MEVDQDAPPNGPHRPSELWFEDGNLIIQAGNSQFRVYRGVLAARSSVFQDMLAFPQPSDSELVEGCPLVHLPDTAGEVTVFLKAIFDSGFFLPYPFPTDLDTIAGTLRLSHKYGVEYLRRRALVHLTSSYPTTLSDFDAVFLDSTEGSPLLEAPSWHKPEMLAFKIFLIPLAREVECLWILPTAFYFLSLSSGSMELGAKIYRGTTYNGMSAGLSEADQEAFLNGSHKQSASIFDPILRFLLFPVEIAGCTQAMCYKRRLQAFEANRQDREDYPYDPLVVWNSSDWELLGDICPVCLESLKQTYNEARQKFWDDLPKMYGLPPWPELERMRTAAIGTDLEVLA